MKVKVWRMNPIARKGVKAKIWTSAPYKLKSKAPLQSAFNLSKYMKVFVCMKTLDALNLFVVYCYAFYVI